MVTSKKPIPIPDRKGLFGVKAAVSKANSGDMKSSSGSKIGEDNGGPSAAMSVCRTNKKTVEAPLEMTSTTGDYMEVNTMPAAGNNGGLKEGHCSLVSKAPATNMVELHAVEVVEAGGVKRIRWGDDSHAKEDMFPLNRFALGYLSTGTFPASKNDLANTLTEHSMGGRAMVAQCIEGLNEINSMHGDENTLHVNKDNQLILGGMNVDNEASSSTNNPPGAVHHEAAVDSRSMTLGTHDTDVNVQEIAVAKPTKAIASWKDVLVGKKHTKNREETGAWKLCSVELEDVEHVSIPLEELSSVVKDWGHTLIGYVAGENPGKGAIIARCKLWKVEHKTYFDESGWIVFRFNQECDRDFVLGNGPYLVHGKPLIIKAKPPYFRFGKDEAGKVPVWIRFPHLPMELWNERALSRIASKLGLPLRTDNVTATKEIMSYARVFIEVDLMKDLKNEVIVSLPGGKSFVQEVIYEYIPGFCDKCMAIGHTSSGCEARKKQLLANATLRRTKHANAPTEAKNQPVARGNGVTSGVGVRKIYKPKGLMNDAAGGGGKVNLGAAVEREVAATIGHDHVRPKAMTNGASGRGGKVGMVADHEREVGAMPRQEETRVITTIEDALEIIKKHVKGKEVVHENLDDSARFDDQSRPNSGQAVGKVSGVLMQCKNVEGMAQDGGQPVVSKRAVGEREKECSHGVGQLGQDGRPAVGLSHGEGQFDRVECPAVLSNGVGQLDQVERPARQTKGVGHLGRVERPAVSNKWSKNSGDELMLQHALDFLGMGLKPRGVTIDPCGKIPDDLVAVASVSGSQDGVEDQNEWKKVERKKNNKKKGGNPRYSR